MAGKLQVHSPVVAVQVMTGFSKPELLWTLPFEGAWSTSLAFAGDDRIVAGNRDGSLFVWNLPVEPPAESDGKTALISECRSSRDSFDRPALAFRLWDVETHKLKFDLLQISVSGKESQRVLVRFRSGLAEVRCARTVWRHVFSGRQTGCDRAAGRDWHGAGLSVSRQVPKRSVQRLAVGSRALTEREMSRGNRHFRQSS
jgi:hypothetical protein